MGTPYDPDVLRWGLHLLDGTSCHLSSPEISETSVQMNEVAPTESVQVCEPDPPQPCNSVENDEAIAHVLQEELSHFDMREAAEEGSHIRREDGAQTSSFVQDLLATIFPLKDNEREEEVARNFNYGSSLNYQNESGQESENEEVSEDDLLTVDWEVERRLTHIKTIPHVPKINGEIPTVDDASADHHRLLDRLKEYGLCEFKMDGDGNCQFRAFSDQLYRTSKYHKDVRECVIKQLKAHPDWYEGYVPMKYSDYVKKMAKNGEWGDHVTLQAGADSFGVRICVLTSFKDTCFIEILPRQSKSKRVVYLSFWSEVHYNSIYPEGDLPLSFGSDTKRGSWHRLFKSRW